MSTYNSSATVPSASIQGSYVLVFVPAGDTPPPSPYFGPAVTVFLLDTNMPSGPPGVSYAQTLTAGGGTGPYTFALTAGSLPTGLSLSSGGAVSGTPTAIGTSSFTVQATDSLANVGSQTLSIQIASSAGGEGSYAYLG